MDAVDYSMPNPPPGHKGRVLKTFERKKEADDFYASVRLDIKQGLHFLTSTKQMPGSMAGHCFSFC
jgi:hypothetical protein